MKRTVISGVMLTLLLVVTFTSCIQIVKAGTIAVPDDYATIQEAVNAANPGDTILVYSGTYYEHLTLSKSLTLKGEGAASTIIDGSGGIGYLIGVYADDVTIEGFTIRNNDALAMWFSEPDNCKIIGNTVIGNRFGIYLSGGQGNCLYKNTITSNEENGVLLVNSKNNIVTENTISNSKIGVYVANPESGIIYHNNFIDNGQNAFSYAANTWDNGYPYGGNYWSNNVDVDVRSGPNQDESGNDGVWDHPYVVNLYSEDRYPLVNPWVPRIVGVQVGDWAKYSVEITGYRPGFPVDLNDVDWGKTTVQAVAGTTIEAELLFHLKNGTEITTTGIVDVVTSGYPGPTSMTVLFVSKDLPAGATLYATYPFGAVPPSLEINETVFKEYSGVSRETNHIDATKYGIHVDEYWDRATGVLSEFNEEYRTYWSVHFKIVDTNLWEAPTPPTVMASLDVDPDSLNLRSKDKWITAYIQLPEGYNPADIDASTILLNGTISPIMDPKYDFVTNSSEYLVDYNNDGTMERMVKFDKVTVESFINSQGVSDGNVALTVTGKLLDGTPFEGTYTIRVFYGGPGGRRR